MPSQAAPVEAIADDAPAPVSTGASTGVSTEASTGASTTEVETVDPGPAATVYHALKKEKAGPAPTATVSERAVSGEDNMTGAKAVSDSKTTKKACKWHLGIHTGLDLGGAIPWPLSDAISKGDKMNVVPKISPALGMSLEYDFLPRWGVVLEATYKTVGMDASIITLNGGQKFSDDGMDVIFYGRAKTSMSFTSFETPLYFIFRISDHNRVFAGGYYAYVPSSKFVASALDGHVVNPDNGAISVVNPASPIDQDFSDTINDWDAGWLVGYERRILSHLTLSGRFSMGLNDIFKPNEKYLDYGMIHMRGTVTLSYRFF
ncbi:hypothetical protein FACS1894159_05490 [Bacteroidia bacterium]|nr:hypothetical protein FACS1894159_05490 [Bacteroidia bacterium]